MSFQYRDISVVLAVKRHNLEQETLDVLLSNGHPRNFMRFRNLLIVIQILELLFQQERLPAHSFLK